jgi:hypothetical protein
MMSDIDSVSVELEEAEGQTTNYSRYSVDDVEFARLVDSSSWSRSGSALEFAEMN